MIQENRLLAQTIIENFPELSRFTHLDSSNPSDERFEQTFNGIFEGLDFTTRNPETLNELLESVEEKIRKASTLGSIKGIVTSSDSVINYNFSDQGIINLTSKPKGDDKETLKLLVKPSKSAYGDELIITYGEVPQNSAQYANGVCTKDHGGTTFITLDKDGNIIGFEQMLDKDKREPFVVKNYTPKTPERLDDDELNDLIDIVSGKI